MGFKTKKQPEEEQPKIKRKVPIDKNNEQYLLGHALSDNKLLEILVSEADSDCFLYPNHRAIYRGLKHLFDKALNVEVDSIDAIKNQLREGYTIKLDYLDELKATFQSEAGENNYRMHISKLRDDKVKDNLMLSLMPDFANSLINPQCSVDDLLQQITKIKDVVETGQAASEFNFIPAVDVVAEHDKAIEDRLRGGTFVTTGYEKLDKHLTEGFSRKTMSIVAGRTGMGKSSFVGNVLLRLGLQGVPVAIYNFEMDKIAMLDRLIAIKAEIPLENIIKKRHQLTEDDLRREKEAKELIKNLPIYFFDRSTQTMEGVKRDIRLLKDKYNVQVIAYDLFDKMKFKHTSNRSTADIINENLKTIQGMSRDYDIHQILVVQIGRGAEKRKNKRPRLNELKDAGGYEERADNILFLYRPSYYAQAEEDMEIPVDQSEEIEVIIAKQRQGAMNKKVMFDFFPVSTCISEPMEDLPQEE